MASAAQPQIDEALYSRQLYVLGHEAMHRLSASSVLILNATNLSLEIAKNLALAGIRKITICDSHLITPKDLSNFYVTREDIGHYRAEVLARRLSELNPYVTVEPLLGKYQDVLSSFSVVVACNVAHHELVATGELCHRFGVMFIAAEMFGLASRVFVDLGKEFTVGDTTGEQPVSAMIASITQGDERDTLLVTVLDEHRHGLESGDYVQFSEVQGFDFLNTVAPLKVSVKGPYTFTIADPRATATAAVDLSRQHYIRGGIVRQVKQPAVMSFLSFSEAHREPSFVCTDWVKIDRQTTLHLGFQALSEFQHLNGGRLPAPGSRADAAQLVELTQRLAAPAPAAAAAAAPGSGPASSSSSPNSGGAASAAGNIDRAVIELLSYGAEGVLAPVAAFLGGVAAQEVMKACTGKFTPAHQWMYFDFFEALPSKEPLPESEYAGYGDRYDGQIAVFGREFQRKMSEISMFLVGAGAIGCEMLKNWALMGVATTPNARVVITDMDTIEKSNLNRQFLFRNSDVGKPKSSTAAEAATQMNPAMRIEAHLNRVGKETEAIYTDEFFESNFAIINALDNLEARLYVDQRCVNTQRPLIDSGTLGTKGNVQVVIPHLTESYSSSQDPPEKSIPICTLKLFPNAIEHTIQWARDLFEGTFNQAALDANSFLTERTKFLETLDKQPGTKRAILQNVNESLVTDRPTTFDDCVTWARHQFEFLFVNQIAQLLYNFPVDMLTASGAPFWSGPKRAPTPAVFDARNPAHMDFIAAAANLRAELYHIPRSSDIAHIAHVASSVAVRPFEPRKNVKIPTNDSEAKGGKDSGLDSLSLDLDFDADKLIASVNAALAKRTDKDGDVEMGSSNNNNNNANNNAKAAVPAAFQLHPIEFEKDDDSNGHIAFITAASNLRASNYAIQTASRHETKLIAGKIIPAIATTTALVTGLVCVELYKLVSLADSRGVLQIPGADMHGAAGPTGGAGTGKTPGVVHHPLLEKFRNSFVNLALPLFAFSDPMPVPRVPMNNGRTFTIWDHFDIRGELTLSGFIEHFATHEQLRVTMISYGNAVLYSSFFPKKDRMPLTMSALIELVCKTRLSENLKSVALSVCATDINDEDKDIDVPWVKYHRAF